VLLGAGLSGVLAATTAGSAVAAVVAVLMLRVPRASGPVQHATGLRRELTTASFGLLAIIALANLDVLLARHHLAAREAGLYAVGAVLAKIAFWAPQSVAVVVFPRLTGDRAREVLRTALLCLAGFGLLLVAGAALLARTALLLVFGEDYVDLAPAAWAFVALGATLAVAHLLVVQRHRRPQQPARRCSSRRRWSPRRSSSRCGSATRSSRSSPSRCSACWSWSPSASS
jgi:O-antigen/teichoic acid export membrane protein